MLKRIGKQDEIVNMHHKSKQKKIKIGKAELREMLNFDTFFDAETALELGFIDEIIE